MFTMSQDIYQRQHILSILEDVLQKNNQTPIPYAWWWRTDISVGLDCSWLVYYVIHQAWLSVPVFTSRSAFKWLPTQLVELDADKKIKKDSLHDIMPWDLLFRNSIDPEYAYSTWPVWPVHKDEKTYRIHHIAFIKDINYNRGEISIIEMNSGKWWLVQDTVNVYDRLYNHGIKNSELYVAKMDYSNLSNILDSEYYKETPRNSETRWGISNVDSIPATLE